GLKPTTPQKAAGRITDPFVWLPMASGTIPAATAAADPLEEPPGVRSGSCGFRVLPGAAEASSVVTVFPRITAPAARSRASAVADGLRRLGGGQEGRLVSCRRGTPGARASCRARRT